ncbi:MAG: hypothetical protein C0484_18165 [Rhodospirillum sp.]|nr:hypothetical protein [Rhodospirillum sp.]
MSADDKVSAGLQLADGLLDAFDGEPADLRDRGLADVGVAPMLVEERSDDQADLERAARQICVQDQQVGPLHPELLRDQDGFRRAVVCLWVGFPSTQTSE